MPRIRKKLSTIAPLPKILRRMTMKKGLRILALIALMLCMAISLVACGGNSENTNNNGTTTDNNGSTSQNTNNAWPTSDIQELVGEGVPAYTGAYDTISTYIGEQAEDVKQMVINMSGVSEGDYNAYLQTLTNNGYTPLTNGYTENIIGYSKTNSKGKVTASPSFNEGFPMINIYLEKSSSNNETGDENGDDTSWPTATINQRFPSANIPVLEGAESCTFEDYSTTSLAYINIVALGITEEEITAYKTALETAGFEYIGLYNESESTAKYNKTVAGKAVNVILSWSLSDERMSIELSSY